MKESDKARELIPTNEQWKRMHVMDNLQLGDITPAIRFNNYVALCDMDLALWMFVPCDGEGNVLEEPTDQYNTPQYYEAQMFQFEKAKKRVIFEGFQYSKRKEKGSKHYLIYKGDKFAVWNEGYNFTDNGSFKTIQDLTNLGLVIRKEAVGIYDL